MTIRLLSTYDGFSPNDIITLDSALETALIAGGNATANLTGGVVAYRERQPVMIQPAVKKRGTVNLIANRKAIVPLTEGSALTITPTAGTTGTYQRYDASGVAVGALTTIGASGLTVGPFEGDFTVEIKCTTGSLAVKVLDAGVMGGASSTSSIRLNPSGFFDDIAINTAITGLSLSGGGTLILGGGTFDIRSSVLPKSNVHIVGQGEGVTILRLHDNTPYTDNANVVFAKASSNADLTNFRIASLTLDGNRDNQQRITTGRFAVSSLSRTGGVATAVVASTATLATGEFAYIMGATGGTAGVYNGGKFITVTGPTTFTFQVGAGTDSATGTITAGTTDNGYNGIVIRGDGVGTYTANNWALDKVELKNCGYHGGAAYDGCQSWKLTNIHSHHNGFRSFHAHAAETIASNDYLIDGFIEHDNGLDTTTGLQGGDNGGLFAVFINVGNVVINNVVAYNERGPAIDIGGTSYGWAALTSLTQSGGVAAGTTASAHGYPVGGKVAVRGSTSIGYNGKVTILSTPTPTTFTYAVPAATVATALGSPTSLLAPTSGAVVSNISIRDCGTGIIIGSGASDVNISNVTIKNCNTTGKASLANGQGIYYKSGGVVGADNINLSNATITDCTSWGINSDTATALWSNCNFNNVTVHNCGTDTTTALGGVKLNKFDRFSISNLQVFENNAGSPIARQLYLTGCTNGYVQAFCDGGTSTSVTLDMDGATSNVKFIGGFYNRNNSANVANLAGSKLYWGRNQCPVGKTVNNTGGGNAVDLFGGVQTTPVTAAAYTVTENDDTILADCTANVVVATLPAAATVPGKELTLIKTDAGANAAQFKGSGAELINAANTKSQAVQYGGFTVKSNGTLWYVKGAF